MDTLRFDKALEGRSGETWRERRRRFGYCDTCLQSALPGLNHCGKCIWRDPRARAPKGVEVLSMQLPQEMDGAPGLVRWAGVDSICNEGAHRYQE